MAMRAIVYNKAISRSITGAMPGRNTFTATSVPSCRRARCTCATEAEAIGVRSKAAKWVVSGTPNARSTMVAASSPANGGTWSWSFASSRAISSGNRSGRVDNICPNFTNTGPSASRASRRRRARGGWRRDSQCQGVSRRNRIR